MATVKFQYHSRRAHEARIGQMLAGSVGQLLVTAAVLLIIFGGLSLIAGIPAGWFIMSLAAVPYMFQAWSSIRLRDLPVGKKADGIDQILASDVLGQLPKNPQARDIATAAMRVTSGRFMAVRFGLSSAMLMNLVEASQPDTQEVWRQAKELHKASGQSQLSAAMLIVALVRCFSGYETILAHIGLDDDDLVAGLRWQQHLDELIAQHAKPRRSGGIARDWSFGYIPLLERFGQNISEQITRRGGALTVDIASHAAAIDQLIETFGSGGRQNAVLVGKEGVGKTTIIHAFAERLLDAAQPLPSSLRFRQIIMLDSSALIAAARGRGELEGLVMQVLAEAYTAKNIIICLDNAQLFFEEGIGAVDLTNVLQPILDAGNLRVILSMDEQRFLQINARNPSLVNALNRITIAPADQDETLMAMQEQLVLIEVQRGVTYMYQAIKEAYRLSERYVYDLAMPGRAIKLLENAASYHEDGLVTINSVQQAIEKTMDVKVSVATETSDRERLLNMESLIHQRMVNQSHAVQVVSDALRRARAGIRNQNRPIGTFLFLGPTGVGKTELSKALAEVYFGGEDRLIRVDLNEYVQSSDVDRLIADGATDASSLTARVMKQPFSVILLDEIEKAAPEVLATLLQVLDEGILRDIKNREISFRDAVIIATSNAGATRIREYIDRGYQLEQFEEMLTDELIHSGEFRPEFLNRFDEIVVFRPFTKPELVQVFDMILAGVNKTLAQQKVTVAVSQEAKELLVERGYDPRLGARPMRRVIQKAVENTIAKRMLSGAVNPGDVIQLDVVDVEKRVKPKRGGVDA